MKNSKIVILLTVLLLAGGGVFSQCAGVVPPFSLGNDTTICAGGSLSLSPGPNFDYYLWSNGSSAPTIVVGQSGTYNVEVGVLGPNVITNGDFQSGNNGFSTDYIYGTGGTFGLLSSEGQYAIATSPSLAHTNFLPCGDHTSGSGNMLIANGSGTPNTNVWCQNVVVSPNTQYLFSAWISNALNDPNVANLQFYVNGIPIGSVFNTATTGCNWQNYSDVWNSGSLTNVNICIVNQNTANSGNDFAIDDISFAPICTESDQIIVSTNPAPAITAAQVSPICAGGTATLSASSSTPNLTYTWMPGSISGQTVNVSPSSSTSYSVTAVSNLGCVSNLAFAPVVVSPSPNVTISTLQDTLCLGENANLLASSASTVTYSWTGFQTTGPTLVDNPSSTTEYVVVATSSNGCQNSDTATITVIQPVTVSIAGDLSFCTDESTTLLASGSEAGINFVWMPANINASSITINASNSGMIYLEGSVYNCPAAVDSVFTQEIETPIVSPISSVETCPGEAVEVTAVSSVPTSSFTWNPFGLSGSTQVFVADETTNYTVFAQNGNCISDTVAFTIQTSLICELEVPNVFTANDDGINDVFTMISTKGIESLECLIVNRWGNSVAEFNTPNFQWDGTDLSGDDVKEGTYFYKITARTQANELLEKQGVIQLVR